MKLPYVWRFALVLWALLAIVVPAFGQDTSAARSEVVPSLDVRPTSATVFRIGCVRYDPDTRISTELAQRLCAYLRSNDKVRVAMQQLGVSDIQVQSFDAHRWLMEAMDAEQIDMAFCSSVDFTYQTGHYRQIYRLRLPQDTPNRDRLYVTASIFVNNRSSLFPLSPEETQKRLPAYLSEHDVALVGPNSAAGYIYPMIRLYEMTTTSPVQPRTQFWGSSEEVVKAVINGSAEIGACDSGVLESVLRASGLWESRHKVFREIGVTGRLARDPLVLREIWYPSALGRSIRVATFRFFEQQKAPLPRLGTIFSEDRSFNDELSGNIAKLEHLRKAADAARK